MKLVLFSHLNHKDVVKLVGVCMHTNFQLLVFEYILYGTHSKDIHKIKLHFVQSWKACVNVDKECIKRISIRLHYCFENL